MTTIEDIMEAVALWIRKNTETIHTKTMGMTTNTIKITITREAMMMETVNTEMETMITTMDIIHRGDDDVIPTRSISASIAIA